MESQVPGIGRILRVYREKRKRNLSVVAGAANISVSMLSQIELGRVSPSIDTLMRVCGALEIEPVELFRHISPSKPVRIFREGERLRTGGSGVTYEQLVASPDMAYPAELFMLEVEPGHHAGLGGTGHEGVEMGYVLKGKARLTVGDTRYDISAGDSISFSAHLPHRLENSQNAVFRAIWSVVPPHKDYLEMEEVSSQKPAVSDQRSEARTRSLVADETGHRRCSLPPSGDRRSSVKSRNTRRLAPTRRRTHGQDTHREDLRCSLEG